MIGASKARLGLEALKKLIGAASQVQFTSEEGSVPELPTTFTPEAFAAWKESIGQTVQELWDAFALVDTVWDASLLAELKEIVF